jgi:DNA-binding MarR family transcriptional regulator
MKPLIDPPCSSVQEPFLSLLRELALTYQAFTSYSDAHIRQMGLTAPQFDVIATLGNTRGMTMNCLAEKTLVTKGTLTGIVDRLEHKGLVRREVPPDNRRCFMIVLTDKGESLFQEIFPAHIAYLKERLGILSLEEIEIMQVTLQKLRSVLMS